jgi:hypothetical protein
MLWPARSSCSASPGVEVGAKGMTVSCVGIGRATRAQPFKYITSSSLVCGDHVLFPRYSQSHSVQGGGKRWRIGRYDFRLELRTPERIGALLKLPGDNVGPVERQPAIKDYPGAADWIANQSDQTGGGASFPKATASPMMRQISAIHNSAPRTLRRGDGVCRICSDIVVSSKSRPRLEAPSARQIAPGAQGSIGVGGGFGDTASAKLEHLLRGAGILNRR